MLDANSTDLIIWGRKNSFNVQKVMWLLAELNCAYINIPAGGQFGLLDTPEFLKMNPHGKIPVISDKGNIVWESHTILRYLAAQYGTEKFWPVTAIQRSKIECWMDWQQTALQPDFLTGIFWGYYRTPEKERNWTAINTSVKKINQHFNLLNTILKNSNFLVDNDFSLADMAVGTTLYRYFELDLEKPDLPYVEKWYQRLKARPAYQQHVMIPFHDMKGRLSF